MVDAVPAATAEALHLKNGGAFIANVDQDGPACHAGLQSGDVVVAYNGKPVTGSEQFAGLIHDSAAGSTVMMTVIRDGQSKDIKVKLGDWRQMAGMPRAPLSPVGTMPFAAPERPPLPPRAYPDIDMMGSTPISARQGIQVEPLSPQLCDFFGVGENKGVLVRTVEKGSPGAAAGLRAGDVDCEGGQRDHPRHSRLAAGAESTWRQGDDGHCARQARADRTADDAGQYVGMEGARLGWVSEWTLRRWRC